MLEFIAWSAVLIIGNVAWFTIGAIIRPYLVTYSSFMLDMDDVQEVSEKDLWERKFQKVKRLGGGFKVFQSLFWPILIVIALFATLFCIITAGFYAINYYGSKLP